MLGEAAGKSAVRGALAHNPCTSLCVCVCVCMSVCVCVCVYVCVCVSHLYQPGHQSKIHFLCLAAGCIPNPAAMCVVSGWFLEQAAGKSAVRGALAYRRSLYMCVHVCVCVCVCLTPASVGTPE